LKFLQLQDPSDPSDNCILIS